MATFDPTRLYSSLLNTGLQTKDNPLYQVIHDIIRTLASVNTQANVSTAAASGGPTTITNITQMIGIPGEDGSDGIDGAPGIQGLTGPRGLSGVDGVDGSDGDDVFIRSNISSSDLSDISNVALLNRDPQTFTGANTFSNVSGLTVTKNLTIGTTSVGDTLLLISTGLHSIISMPSVGANSATINYGTAGGDSPFVLFSNKTGVGTVFQMSSVGNLSISIGTLGVGTLAVAQSAITTNNSITAIGSAGYQLRMLGTLTASANNDSLYGLYINPTFATGGFTGVIAYGLRIPSVTGVSTNYALYTEAGLVRLGDTLSITKVDATGAFSVTSSTGTNPSYMVFLNTSPNQALIGLESSIGNAIFSPATPYALAIGTYPGLAIKFATNNVGRWFIHPLGGLSSDTTDPGVNNLRVTGTEYLGGKVTTYNSIDTTGYGIPAIYDTRSLTAQVANIVDTNFTNGNVAGFYKVSYYLVDTIADLTAGTVTLNIKYTDVVGPRTISSAPVALTVTTAFTQGIIFLQQASGNVTFGVTSTGIFGTSTYALYLTLERIN